MANLLDKEFIPESSLDTIFIVTKTGKIVYISQSAKDIGYEPKDMIGTSFTKYIPTKELPLYWKKLKEIFLKKKVQNFESYIKSYNGKNIPVEINGKLVKREGKLFAQGTIRNITERKQLEKIHYYQKNLQNQKLLTDVSYLFNKTENVDDNLNNAIGLVGEHINVSRISIFQDFDNGKYTKNIYEWCNKNIKSQIDNLQTIPYKIIPSYKKILNEKGIVISSNIFELPKDMINILEPQKIKSILIFPIYIKNNFWGFMCFDECEKIRTWDETDVELIKTLVNITSNLFERRKAEEELKQALVKAEESDKLKSTFITIMSHELRTPLTAIIGLSGIISNFKLSISEIKDYANSILLSGNSLLQIIEDIFYVSLIETNEAKIIKEKFSLNKILKEIHTTFSNDEKIQNNQINLILNKELEDGKDIIYTDETKLNKILKNLIENAIKFTHRGTIEFGYTVKDDINNALLQFYVKDTGIGIPEDKQLIIFERFRQADDSTTRKYNGIGLGLHISKKLVEMLGGKIWVESEEDKGSTFYFTIPIEKKIRAKRGNVFA